MFCPKCGKNMPDTAKFCGNCGYKFEKSGSRKQVNAKTKKFVKKIIIAVLCCVCLPILVCFIFYHIPTSDWCYCFDNSGKAVITGYNGKESEIVVPETVKRGWISYDVTKIGWKAFYGCSNLTSIEIPEGVTEIGHGTFANCSSLTSIEIPEGVTEIGSQAFWECSSLTSVKIPKGVTKIGSEAFYGCRSLRSIEIPKSVTEIAANAFYRSGIETSGSGIRITDNPFH